MCACWCGVVGRQSHVLGNLFLEVARGCCDGKDENKGLGGDKPLFGSEMRLRCDDVDVHDGTENESHSLYLISAREQKDKKNK